MQASTSSGNELNSSSGSLLKRRETGHNPFVQRDNDTTIDLINRAKRGDRDAFEELVRLYERRVRSFCALSLRGEAQGDDAAQEVFIKAYRSIKNFRGDASFATWLLTLAKHQCIDIIRRERRKSELSLDAILDQEYSIDGDSGERLESKAQAGDTLRKMLGALSVNHRFILLLKEFYGLSYDEIAGVLGLSIDGVKGQLKRARVRAEEVLRHLSSSEGVATEGDET